MHSMSSMGQNTSRTFGEGAEKRILRFLCTFNTMEKEHPQLTQSLYIEGLNVWPLVRMAFFFNTCNSDGWKARHHTCMLSTAPPPTAFIAAFEQFPKGMPVLYAPAWYHVCNVAQKLRREPTLDRLADTLSSMGKAFIKLWHDPWAFDEQAQYPGILLPPQEEFVELPGTSFTLDGYTDYAALALHHGLPVVRKEEIFSLYCKVISYARYFAAYLRCLQSSAVFHVCYYETRMMGLALACRELGIPCVECQHGMQDTNHLMYEFPSLPDEGYDLVPEWFLQWGDISYQKIQQYFTHTTQHKALIGGRPPMVLPPLPELQAMCDTLRKTIGSRKAILVTIQASEILPIALKEQILDAFDTAPADWFWLLRDHPVTPALLPRTTSPCMYDRHLCSSLPLEEVLALSAHHITWTSSVTIEASAQNIATTIIGDIATTAFTSLVDAGIVFFAHSTEALLEHIQKSLCNTESRTVGKYISTEPMQLKAAINVILNKNSR